MNKMKRILAVLCAMVMTLAMAIPASAATITINGGTDEGSTYAAYKLLNAVTGENDSVTYTINSQYAEILNSVTNNSSDVVAYIGGLDTDGIRTFADAVYEAILTAELEADYTTTENSIQNAAQGYYLIAETSLSQDNTTGTHSLVMLDTAGQTDIQVTTKEDVPTLVKKVQETNDSAATEDDRTSGWQDAADYDIGDNVPFQLTGTVSDRYASYNTYYYAFHDTLSPGLTFNATSVVVTVGDAEAADSEYTTIDPSNYTVVRDSSELEAGCTFEVRFKNLKDIPAVNANSNIVVTYTAELNGGAVIGSQGNPNDASLEYSNNPYDTWNPDDTENPENPEKPGTSETPEDRVIVFTYAVVTNKTHEGQNGEQEPLTGAGFTLYKFNGENNAYAAVGDEITGVTTFTFTGIDAGLYRLEETTTPPGYNGIAPIYFTVAATYTEEANEPELTSLTVTVTDSEGTALETQDGVFTVNQTDGTITTDVENQAGTELPATGGIGTKIFYTIGAILMIGAAVLFITRRRVAK